MRAMHLGGAEDEVHERQIEQGRHVFSRRVPRRKPGSSFVVDLGPGLRRFEGAATDRARNSVQVENRFANGVLMTRLILSVALLGLATPAFAQTQSVPDTAAAASASGLSFDQWAARGRERLMALDTDHDGKISKEEFAARSGMMRGGAPGGGGAESGFDGSRMFARLDSNNDGYLDAAEINAMLARRFARMDANHDGVLTGDERQAMRGMNAPEQ